MFGSLFYGSLYLCFAHNDFDNNLKLSFNHSSCTFLFSFTRRGRRPLFGTSIWVEIALFLISLSLKFLNLNISTQSLSSIPRGFGWFFFRPERLDDFFCPERLGDFFCPERLGDFFLVPRGWVIFFLLLFLTLYYLRFFPDDHIHPKTCILFNQFGCNTIQLLKRGEGGWINSDFFRPISYFWMKRRRRGIRTPYFWLTSYVNSPLLLSNSL